MIRVERARRHSERGKSGSVLVRFVAVVLAACVSVQGVPGTAYGAGETRAQIDKTVVGGPATYKVGDTVTYRLSVQCSSLVGPCGVGTITDPIDPNLDLSLADVILPTTTVNGTPPPPITKTLTNGTLVITVGTDGEPFLDGQAFDVTVVATVKSYPIATNGEIPNGSSIAIANGAGEVAPPVVIKVEPLAKDWGLVKVKSRPMSNPAPGELVTFAINFTRPVRSGGIDIAGAVLTDQLPADLEFVSATSDFPVVPGVYDAGKHAVSWRVPTLPANAAMNCAPSGCISDFVAYVTVRIPPNGITSAMPAGTTYTNDASAVVTYADQTTGGLTASAAVSTAAPTIKASSGKSGPSTTAPDGKISWRMFGMNDGNVTLHNAAVVDALPVDGAGNLLVDQLELFRQYPGSQPLNPRGQPVNFSFSVDGVTWTDDYAWDSAVNTPTVLAVPTSARFIRMRVPSLGPNAMLDISLRGHVPVDTSLDAVVTNCATLGADELPDQTPKCVTTTVDPLTTLITPFKADELNQPGQVAVVPGEVFLWKIGFSASGSLPISTATVSDLLPKEFELVDVKCFTSYGLGGGTSGAVTGGPCGRYPVPAYTAAAQADGATLITFKDITLPDQATQNDLAYGIYLQVRVRPGASIATYTNEVRVLTNDAVTTCTANYYASYGATDTTDIDGDGNTTEPVCAYPDTLPVVESAAVEMTKWDMGTLPNVFEATGTATPPAGSSETACPNWAGYTRYPCVAVTTPGDDFSYRLRLQNSGNVPMTNYVMYDILPVVGDTGVGQLLSAGKRGTEWSPVLAGPVTLDGLSDVANSDYQVEYNLTSNPCRPELNATTPDATWQAECDDTWYTEATLPGGDWAAVRSFRITMFQDDQTWAPAGLLVFDVPMKAPLNAPQSVEDPLDPSVAWNSAAQRVYRTSATGARWMKPYEPRKVGIIVPFTLIKVSVGDYVWYDSDGDGVQDAGESPAEGVKVILRDAAGNQIDQTRTNANGYYWFVNLEPETEYSLEFVKPYGYAWTATDSATGTDATDSDVDRAGKVTLRSPSYEVNGVNNRPGAPDKTDDPTLDAGLIEFNPFVSVGDHVWYDTNRDGVQDDSDLPVESVVVNLYAADGATLIGSTATDANGFYSFGDLTPNTNYVVEFVKPANVVFTTVDAAAAGDSSDSDANPTTGRVKVVAPASGANSLTEPDDPSIDAGLVRSVSVGDYVWFDHNRDGLQTAGEPGVPNVIVNLYDATGTLLDTTTTDASGFYAFGDLLALANYTIEFIRPAETSFTGALDGDASKDSDADPVTGRFSFTAPASGNNLKAPELSDDPTIDAGLVQYNLRLTKTRTTSETIHPGETVEFQLVPTNDGPSAALAGWSVIDLLPDGLALVSMNGVGFHCTGNVCLADAGLPAGSTGNPITVVAKPTADLAGKLWNVAYVAPGEGDAPEKVGLGEPPASQTDTVLSVTDNDDQDFVVFTPAIEAADDSDDLAYTGSDGSTALLLAGLLLLAMGGGLVWTRRSRGVN